MNLKIAVLPGDGIGPEVTEQAIKVLNAIAINFNHTVSYTYADVGAIAIDNPNDPLPETTLQIAKKRCHFIWCDWRPKIR
jgi:3-isopropylmalate dehydrogenase